MNQGLFGPITLAHVVGAVVVIVIVSLLKKLHSGKQENVHVGQTRCTCGWSGSVSKYNRCVPSVPSRSGCKPGTARGDVVGQWVEALPGLRY